MKQNNENSALSFHFKTKQEKKRYAIITMLMNLYFPGWGYLYLGLWKLALAVPFTIFAIFLGIGWSSIAFIPFMVTTLYVLAILAYFTMTLHSFWISRKLTPCIPNKSQRWYYYLLYPFVFVAIIFFIPVFSGYRFFYLPASSMATTLLKGDYIVVDTRAYSNHHPKRGDLVVFKYPKNPQLYYVKRCVATASDRVFILDKVLYLHPNESNETIQAHYPKEQIVALQGELWVKNPYQKENPGIHFDPEVINDGHYPPPLFHVPPLTVAQDSCFMMGDNRDHSNDSRFWGMASKEYFSGKPKTIYFSLEEEPLAVRWERIGLSL